LTSTPATVTITVRPVNDAPLAVNDNYTITEDTQLTVGPPGVLANDVDVEGDTLTVSRTITPPAGTLDLKPDGSFVYAPPVDFVGVDTFKYELSDGSQTSTGTVTIVVNPP
jgi:large repetitive protein